MSDPTPQLQLSDVTAGAPTWLLGILIFTISILASVIAYLFRYVNRRTLSHEKHRRELEQAHERERATWIEEKAAWDAEREAERETERADYETKHRELIERYEELARADREAHITREDQLRHENAANLERIAQSAQSRSASELALLEKLSARIGGRRKGLGG